MELTEQLFSEETRKNLYFFFISNLTITNEDCEDLVQDTILKAYDMLNTYKPTGKFFTWLCVIGKHHFIDNTIRKRKISVININEVESDENSTEIYKGFVNNSAFETENYNYTLKQVFKSFKSLSPIEKKIAKLRFIEKLKNREIAERLNISINTVLTITVRAKKKLSNHIGIKV